MTLRAFVGGAVLAAGAAICAHTASAADLPSPIPTKVPVAPVAYAPAAIYNWTGFYIGGNLGAGFSNSSWSDPFGGGSNTFRSGVGFLGGGEIGANYQMNMLVVGLEGDFDWTNLKGSGADSIGDTLNTNTKWTSTVTGRVGAAFDRLLIYGKGGLALAQDQSGLTDLAGNSASTSFMRTGWTVGAGLEYGITKNWSAKIEYDYLNFGSQALNFATPLQPAYASNASLNAQEIKVGINFRFGGP
jgi:outer membrane immunogenic protein